MYASKSASRAGRRDDWEEVKAAVSVTINFPMTTTDPGWKRSQAEVAMM